LKLLTNLLFEPKGRHDPALAYSIKDTVMSADGARVYFALQDVPPGVSLEDTNYWILQIDLSNAQGSGTGEDGGYYTPSVNTSGVLSWTASKADMPSIASANIKGPQGDPVRIQSIIESNEDGGENIITFTDGKTLVVRNGSTGTGANALSGETDEITPSQVLVSIYEGRNVFIGYTHALYGRLYFTDFLVASALNLVVASGVFVLNNDAAVLQLMGDYISETWSCTVNGLAQTSDIPARLPNPYSLSFTGAVTGSYDGSSSTTIHIPTIAGEAGYTPVKGVDYWTDADKKSIVQQVIAALGTPVFGQVDDQNNIILPGELAQGSYTLKYEHGDGSRTEICTFNISGETGVPDTALTWSIGTKIDSDTGAESASSAYAASNYINVVSGWTYTLAKSGDTAIGAKVCYYDAGKAFISTSSDVLTAGTGAQSVNVPMVSGAKYFRVRYYNSNGASAENCAKLSLTAAQ